MRQRLKFEGQAALELEFAIGSEKTEKAYSFEISERTTDELDPHHGRHTSQTILETMTVDWESTMLEILRDLQKAIPVAQISIQFHNTLVGIIVEIAGRVGEERVILTGGCFKNRFLLEGAIRRLQAEGFSPYWHHRIPPNDAGIAVGQIIAASRLIKQRR